jgi:hypothetical protein
MSGGPYTRLGLLESDVQSLSRSQGHPTDSKSGSQDNLPEAGDIDMRSWPMKSAPGDHTKVPKPSFAPFRRSFPKEVCLFLAASLW